MKLARRSVSSKNLPKEDQLPLTHTIDSKKAITLAVDDILSRLKLGTRLNHVCKVKAEQERNDKKNEGLNLEAITNKNEDEFGRLASSYIFHIFNETQGHFGLTSDIVHGLGSFDLEALLSGSLEYLLGCFKQLFNTFFSRRYFTEEQESQCLEEYRSFVDELRRIYPDMAQPTLLITDTIGFLVELPCLRTCRLLYSLFTLSCLCLDEPFQTLPVVKFNSIRTHEPSSRLADIILPVQSYFKNVSLGIATLSSDVSVAKFLSLEATLGDGALRDSYDPWSEIDLFGRAKILAQLDPNESRPSEPKRTSMSEVSKSSAQEK